MIKENSSITHLNLNVNGFDNKIENIQNLFSSLSLNNTITNLKLINCDLFKKPESIKYINDFISSNSSITKLNISNNVNYDIKEGLQNNFSIIDIGESKDNEINEIISRNNKIQQKKKNNFIFILSILARI